MRIAVTGGSGKLGSSVVDYLLDAGHDILSLDRVGTRGAGFLAVDFTDYGQVVDALHEGGAFDAVVHLAAIPASAIAPEVTTFHNNMLSTFNVFQAARRSGVKTIVYASSETLLGIPFDAPPPYLPLDENYDSRPESIYAVVKHLEEELAQKLVRWDESLSITALRFSNVMSPEDYAGFGAFTPESRKWNLWGYIDARDGAQAILLAVQRAKPGFDRFLIANSNTVLPNENDALIAEFYPGVEVRGDVSSNVTLLSIEKARRELGYQPKFDWKG
jgi:nucleoside-diphosphate-sugar epimerase